MQSASINILNFFGKKLLTFDLIQIKKINNSMWSSWLKAIRLRTLPLSLSCTGMGNLIAYINGGFKIELFWLSFLTTIFLQVLSNLANDLGDSIHGADSDARKGPQRMVQSGAISRETMKNAVLVLALLSFVSGLSLIWLAFYDQLAYFFAFLALGLLAIGAAILYTNGSKPYGYQGFGDFFVFLFFGIVAVYGTSFLHLKDFNWNLLLPAVTMGCFATGVLNINNMRDIDSDKLAGKFSIPVRIGLRNAKMYHTSLMILALLSWAWFEYYYPPLLTFGKYAIFIIILVKELRKIWEAKELNDLDKRLKPLAIFSLAFLIINTISYTGKLFPF